MEEHIHHRCGVSKKPGGLQSRQIDGDTMIDYDSLIDAEVTGDIWLFVFHDISFASCNKTGMKIDGRSPFLHPALA